MPRCRAAAVDVVRVSVTSVNWQIKVISLLAAISHTVEQLIALCRLKLCCPIGTVPRAPPHQTNNGHNQGIEDGCRNIQAWSFRLRRLGNGIVGVPFPLSDSWGYQPALDDGEMPPVLYTSDDKTRERQRMFLHRTPPVRRRLVSPAVPGALSQASSLAWDNAMTWPPAGSWQFKMLRHVALATRTQGLHVGTSWSVPECHRRAFMECAFMQRATAPCYRHIPPSGASTTVGSQTLRWAAFGRWADNDSDGWAD